MRLRSFPAAAVAAALLTGTSLLGATGSAAQTTSQPTVSVVPLAPVGGPTTTTLGATGVSLVPGSTDTTVAATTTTLAPPTALLVSGRGFGHGRGMSQWGAYGYARMGWDRERILERYYGGTVRGAVSPSSSIGVRLTARDGKALVVYNPKGRVYTAVPGQNGYTVPPALAAAAVAAGLVAAPTTTTSTTPSTGPVPLGPAGADGPGAPVPAGVPTSVAAGPPVPSGGATPSGSGVLTGSPAAVRIVLGAGGTWQISDGPGCNGPWTLRVPAVGTSVTVSTGPTDPALGPDDPDGMLQLCESATSRRVYRGDLLTVDGKPGQRTVNVVGLESYLRGVLPREIHAAWGDDGPEALAVQAVAARSYASAEKRTAYANTCDTIDCQVYRGRGTYDGAKFTNLEDTRTDRAVAATAGEIRVDPKSGKPVRTEFCSSSGGYTAPGAFPPVRDEGDDIAANPHHSWIVAVPRARLENGRRLGSFRGASVLARDGFGEGGGRVTQLQLQFTGGNALVSGAEFMKSLGLKSSWFDVAVTTDPRYGGVAVVTASVALTGDAGPTDPSAPASGTRGLLATTTTAKGKTTTTKARKTTKGTVPKSTIAVSPVTEVAPPSGDGGVTLVVAAAAPVRSVVGGTTTTTKRR